MNNQVISFLQEKGGAGKTIDLIIIASHMSKDGAKIAMIDTDQRKNLYRFCSKQKLNFDYKYVDDDNLIKPTIRALKNIGYDAIFIDTEGYKSTLATYVIANSDLVFIPCKADESNAICAARTYQRILSVSDNFDKEIPTYVIMSDIDPSTNITNMIKKSIEKQGIPIMKNIIGHATGFKEMLSTGLPPKSGAARKYSGSIMCELQMNGLLEFYSKKEVVNA